MTITVKCIQCGKTKQVGPDQTEHPMCDDDLMPMIAVKVES